MTRIGLVADTHCPEFAERLPASLFDALDGVEAILHAGDVNAHSTLEALSRIAHVEAVRGDHDRALTNLPSVRELTIGGKRIVLVHGQRAGWIEEPQTLLWTLTLGWYRPHRGLPRSLRRRFPDADVIVYGHTHRADVRQVGGALVINPGGVHQWNAETTRRRLAQRPGWFEWCWLQVAKHLVHVETPSVAVLVIDDGQLMPRIVRL